MQISGTTEIFLVVADPVAQVKAPQLYNILFEHARIDAVCVPAQVRPEHLERFVREALAVGNVRGLFVSIPHKTPLLQLLDRCSRTAVAAGAVNAVRIADDGALEGALFDGVGFVASLDEHTVSVAGAKVLLLGAGGAGLAIASALAERPLDSLAVFDADAARAAALIERATRQAGFAVSVADSADPAGFDVVVNATPLGLKAGDALPLDPARLESHATVIDILMTRAPTPLLDACRRRGVRAFPGHEMLIQQVPAYLEFFGLDALAARLRDARDPLLAQARKLLTGSVQLL